MISIIGFSRTIFQIRGIGERSQFVEPLNPSVGLIVDGVDLSGLAAAANLFDVQQVEVLRGPRGTLYGANAMAVDGEIFGLINVVTPDATEALSGSLQVDAGNYSALGCRRRVRRTHRRRYWLSHQRAHLSR